MTFSDSYRNKKVLLTGDTGFKGSWMAIWLLELGADVYGYALPAKSPVENFEKAGLSSKIKHMDGDVRDLKKMKDYFAKVQPDIAFHLAAQSLVTESYDNPVYNYETNVMGAVNFFECIRNTPSVKAAVNVTTDKCYENKETGQKYKETDPLSGHDPYSASKACSEIITQSYVKSFFNKKDSCKIASARAGNVIGGGDWAANRIVPDIFRSVESKKKLIVRNANAIRPWQFVLEPIRGYLVLGQKLLTDGDNFVGAWNFGPSDEADHSVLDLVNQIKDKEVTFDYAIENNNVDKKHEAQILKLDISKAVNILKWKPLLNFEETVALTRSTYLYEIKNKNNVYQNRADTIKLYSRKS